MSQSTWSRRDFARVLALTGSAALVPRPARSSPWLVPQAGGEPFWQGIRDQFLMPPQIAMFNAANLCPASERVIDVLERASRDIDRDPSPQNRAKFGDGREEVRRQIATFVGAEADEVVITRNTSEANNLVSSGLDLGPGDEVLLFADNHPSNNTAWVQKAERAGFEVRTLEQPAPHPGLDYYVDTVRQEISPRTRVLAFTHVTSTVGDLMPAAELCRLARARGVLTLVDGAQTFGVLDVNLAEMQPDFYTGSAHKWPCGARENGLLYVNRAVHDRIAPSVISLYGGRTGISRSMEAHGQRDDAAMLAFGEAVRFQLEVGKARLERRARALASAFVEGLQRIDGVEIRTSADSRLRSSIVVFQPGSLNPGQLSASLYENHGVVSAGRGQGVRLSPHFYNTMAEVERTLAAVGETMRAGAEERRGALGPH
jgi:selenocysteine lyase/cysteine desulfurase